MRRLPQVPGVARITKRGKRRLRIARPSLRRIRRGPILVRLGSDTFGGIYFNSSIYEDLQALGGYGRYLSMLRSYWELEIRLVTYGKITDEEKY